MHRNSNSRGRQHKPARQRQLLGASVFLLCQVPRAAAIVYPSNHELYRFDHLSADDSTRGIHRPLTKRDNPIPLVVTNQCGDTIWPGIATQHGDPPESSGFQLDAGETKNLTVGPTWQGRVWGRTNCTTDGATATCQTGDCFGKLDCGYSGAAPATLAEFNFAGGTNGDQTFYDISLVDGYNLPVGVVYIPTEQTSSIPPNLVNPTCIATSGWLGNQARTGFTYTNSSFPMPYESRMTNSDLSNWCPWDLQAFPPMKPGDGVYPYPDDNVERPVFDPCKSACAATNKPKDCCTGHYNTPQSCSPSAYSDKAKAICPDAYSYAFDDQTSTFIIPSGGGWEIVFCPAGRSTNILATFASELQKIGSAGGAVPNEVLQNAMNESYIEAHDSAAACVGDVSAWGVTITLAVMEGAAIYGIIFGAIVAAIFLLVVLWRCVAAECAMTKQQQCYVLTGAVVLAILLTIVVSHMTTLYWK
ncbi:thaumatin family protein [Xylariomycetidae sp. FL0641]|nr:thaumatin family protein [Xylariomycetidae sp. FL0641]